MKTLRSLFFATLALPAAALAQNLLLNPSFELSGPVAGSMFSSTAFVNWSHPYTGQDYALLSSVSDPSLIAADGNQYVAFRGIGTATANYLGWLSQSFTAVIGQQYTASLYVRYVGSGNLNGVKINFQVSDNNTYAPVHLAQFIAGSTLTDTWTQQSFTFTAPSTSLSFSISDATDIGYGYLTGVQADLASLTAIPEPSTYAVIFGVVTLGAAGVRVLRRRKQLAA